MKLSILATALISAAAAHPTAPVPSARSLVVARADTCWTNSATDATTAASPLVTDCQALSESNLPGTWVPSEENHNTFDVKNGTCGFKGVFGPNGGSLPADQMTVSPALVSNALEYAIEHMAVDGRVGAYGDFACMIPGRISQLGWVSWEIYTVE